MKNPIINLVLQSKFLPIHYRYLLILKYWRLTPPVAKTDLWNELNTCWPIPADIYIEFDEEMVRQSVEKKINAIHSSITAIGLANQCVSTVIDLSTIDHIENPLHALLEYHRILKNGPDSGCILVCWTGTKPSERMSVWHGWQYYFREDELVRNIYKAGFYIHDQGVFDGLGDDLCELRIFHLRKQTGMSFLPDFLHRILFRRELLQNAGKTGQLRKKLNFKTIAVFSPAKLFRCSEFNGNIKVAGVDKRGIHFIALNEDPWIILPETAFSGDHLIIETDITVTETTIFQVFYLESSQDQYNEIQSAYTELFAGRQIARLFIPVTRLAGRIRIDPGNYSGNYSIHGIRFCN